MNLSHLKAKKAHPVRFEEYKSDDGDCPLIFVRLADNEYGTAVADAVVARAKELGCPEENLPASEYPSIGIKAKLGSVVTGWRNWTDADGHPLPDRDDLGGLNVEVGHALLSVEEIADAIELECIKLRAARDKRFKEALGNSEAPLPPS